MPKAYASHLPYLRSDSHPNPERETVYRVEIQRGHDFHRWSDYSYPFAAENVARREAKANPGTHYRVVELAPGRLTGPIRWSGVYETPTDYERWLEATSPAALS